MTAFRQNDRQTTPPRTNARPRRTLRGRFMRALHRERKHYREAPFLTALLTILMIASAIWLRHTFPRGFVIGVPVYWTLVLIHHWWSNRGAE